MPTLILLVPADEKTKHVTDLNSTSRERLNSSGPFAWTHFLLDPADARNGGGRGGGGSGGGGVAGCQAQGRARMPACAEGESPLQGE